MPCHRPRWGRHLPRTDRSHPRGAESSACKRSPADEAAPGLALPRSLSVGDRIVTAAANQAGDCSTAITVPGSARLHPPWVAAAVRTPKPRAQLQLQPGSVPSRHCHVLAISSPEATSRKPSRGTPTSPTIAHSLAMRTCPPATCPPPACSRLCHDERATRRVGLCNAPVLPLLHMGELAAS